MQRHGLNKQFVLDFSFPVGLRNAPQSAQTSTRSDLDSKNGYNQGDEDLSTPKSLKTGYVEKQKRKWHWEWNHNQFKPVEDV